MKYHGVLKKMTTEHLDTIQYYLDMKSNFLNMNQLLNKNIHISFVKYECLSCHLEKPIYRQGFCKKCFFESPRAGDWIIRPELSKAHLNIEDRDLGYEKSVQLQPHIVYLAFSSGIKVGVTRKQQIPFRWIDQGATKAIKIVEAPNRYLAGITEVALKEHISDKTSWKKMLETTDSQDNQVHLFEKKKELFQYIPKEVKPYFINDNVNITTLHFPVLKIPEKIKSLNLTKTPTFYGKLKGIKGQYLIFEDNTVFNVRANEGLVVDMNIN